MCKKLVCLTEIYTLYELDKHIGMTNVKFVIFRASSPQDDKKGQVRFNGLYLKLRTKVTASSPFH